jgi:hypothetical protein
MNTEIVGHLFPEEHELARKREELAFLQAELTERELFLANLRAELAAFEGRYLREVGVLYAELDDWNAKIAELAAEADASEDAKSASAEAREQADESYTAAHGEAARAVDFSPSPELKKLFKEVVNQVHPDRATSEDDRAWRERLMKQTTAAYRRGDAEALRKILEEYRSSPEAIKGEGAAADLQRVLRQIERISKRLGQIEADVAELTSSEIALLMATVLAATAKGRSLLAEMAKEVQQRIQSARNEHERRRLKMRPQ